MLSFPKSHHKNQITGKALSLIPSYKRVSFLSSPSLKGSMALEGCLVLPLFLFFIVTLLFSLEIVRFQSDCMEALYQAGNKECMMAGKEDLIEETYMRQYLDAQVMPYLCLRGEREGITVTRHRDDMGNLELEAFYSVRPFVPWLPVGTIQIKEHFFGHEWVGYLGNGSGGQSSETELYVYVTQSGERYHCSPGCTYLKTDLRMVSKELVKALRNASGEKYYACEVCGSVKENQVYISRWGNRYHSEAGCSALKRTVYRIPLSQAGSRTPCSKCGKDFSYAQ